MADNWPEGVRTVGYSLRVTAELKQESGRLSPLPGTQAMYSDTKHQIEDRFGRLRLATQNNRGDDTNYSDISAVRRWIRKPLAADAATLLGRHDKQSTRVDIKMPNERELAEAVRVYHDDRMFDGFYGNAYTGEYGDTAVPFTPGNVIAHGGAGVTLAKLQALMKKFNDNDVNTEAEQPILMIDNQGLIDLQNIPEYKNADFNTDRPLATGEIKGFLGFRFIRVNFNSTDAYPSAAQYMFPNAGEIALPAFVPSGLHRGVWTEFFMRMGEDPGKKWQDAMYVEACSAITRVEEKKCFQLVCNGR